jgi:hypothetical protein
VSHTIASPSTTKVPASTASIIGRWMLSFVGFPLGGLVALLLTDPVDSVRHAVTGGLLTGAVLGAVQAWALRADRRQLVLWTLATALGLAVGLTLGSSLVEFGTSMGELGLQGAVTGAAVGLAQALVMRGRTRLAFVWPLYLAAAWALGWVITTAGGIAVEDQFTTFGAYGALTVALLTSVLPVSLATHFTSTTSTVTSTVVTSTGTSSS